MTRPICNSATRHGRLEDGYALVVGSILLALGLSILHAAGLVTGGMAGIALLVRHWVDLPPGLLFALLNIPFLFLALRVLGGLFTLRTVLGSSCIALLSTVAERSITIHVHDPLVAAIGAGSLLGMGALAFVRHGAGVGGVGIVTFWLHHRRGWNMGAVQFGIDALVLAASTCFLTLDQIAWSALSAIVMGAVVALWHRPDRYLAMSPSIRGDSKGRPRSDDPLSEEHI